jgi:hypothetical protein
MPSTSKCGLGLWPQTIELVSAKKQNVWQHGQRASIKPRWALWVGFTISKNLSDLLLHRLLL